MTTRERIRNILEFKPADRMPVLEWGPWWHLTLERWRSRDGLNPAWRHVRWVQPGFPVQPPGGDLGDHLGLDPFRLVWLAIEGPECPPPPGEGLGLVADADDYERLRPLLYPEPEWLLRYFRELAEFQKTGDMALWMWIEGFFWAPRKLFGIEEHLFAFYDQPELMRRINQDVVDWYRRFLPRLFEIVTPDILVVAEDLSYNHGPMLSKDAFDAQLAPCYRQLVPLLKSFGIHPLMDSDGDITAVVPWLKEVGIEGIAPLERMAGVDLAALRREHPDLLLLGGFDKLAIARGEAAMRAEFERLLPVIREGGYLLTPDHQTPPDVSLDDFALYHRLLREYTGY